MSDMNTGAVQRPTLLTVICILSFLFGAYSLFDGIRGATHEVTTEETEKVEQAMVEAQEQAAGNPAIEGMMESMQTGTENLLTHGKQIGMWGAIAAAVSLLGVWFMWSLKKMGFWIYLLATVVGLAMPLNYIGANVVGYGYIAFMGFVSLVFIILYAVNLKHMH